MEVKTYASAKSAKAAAKKAGCANPLIVEMDGRYRWSAPKAKPPAAKQGTAATKVQREQRNGVKRPSAGGLCAAVWEYLDKHGNCMPADLRPVAETKGWNVNNTSIELYQWRRFHNLGRPAKG